MKAGAADIRDMADQAVEAPLYPDHREVELRLLATLATVINSDQADLKYDLWRWTWRSFTSGIIAPSSPP